MTEEEKSETSPKLPEGRFERGPVLILENQNKPTETFRVAKERAVIGSVISSDIHLVGEGVSPIHAVIEVVPVTGRQGASVATVFDLASGGGVFVNDKKVVTSEISQGDTLRIGSYRLKVTVEGLELPQKQHRDLALPILRNEEQVKTDFAVLFLEDERKVDQVFDFRPTRNQSLEVIMAWKGIIVDVKHFSDSDVTIGTSRRCDFGIPPVLDSKKFPLIRHHRGEFRLTLNEHMTGVIQRNGELENLEVVRASATKVKHGFELGLSNNDFAKLSFGEIDFYLSFTAAPPALRSRRILERDPFFIKIFGTSLALTGALIVALLNTKVSQSVVVEELPDRIATILYQPEKYSYLYRKKVLQVQDESPVRTPRPKLKKLNIVPKGKVLKKVPQVLDYGKRRKRTASGKKPGKRAGGGVSGMGAGARAKGKKGLRGTKTGRQHIVQRTRAARPSKKRGRGEGGGKSQVGGTGNLSFLKGTSEKIQNLLGSTTARLGKSGRKLKGFSGFDTRGTEGLALSGRGRGGGGNAASLGGLAKRGQGGARIGTGLGTKGLGATIAGGRARVELRQGGGAETIVMGAIDADAVEAALLRHRDEFRFCYEREINAGNPRLAGRVGTRFVIGPRGKVTKAGIVSSSLRNSRTERCVLRVIRRIQFPIPRGGGLVQVKYPFKFRSVGR